MSHFHFDAVSHRFVERKIGLKFWLVRIAVFFCLSVLVSFFLWNYAKLRNVLPKETRLLEEKEELLTAYQNLEIRVRDLEGVLVNIQQRDDSIYRSVFELEPLPMSIREVGLGGSKKYDYLQGYSSSPILIDMAIRVDKVDNLCNVQTESLNSLQDKAIERELFLSHKPSIQPVSLKDFFWISSLFGLRTDPLSHSLATHSGLDFAAAVGTNVFAAGPGHVILTRISQGGYGKEVVIDHGFGYSTRYAHLNSINVKKGQLIKRGAILGSMGDSGKSTGPHLHYEVRLYNKPLNPKYFYSEDLSPDEYRQIIDLSKDVDN